jgi:phosphoribosylamine--glycine ligase
MREIVEPTARTMAEAGTPFSGVLYAGLMLTAEGPKLIEYNVRFGDPECEAIMPRIEGDFAALLYAVATGADFEGPRLSSDTTMTVIVAAKGYPGTPAKGGAIGGLAAAEQTPGSIVFQAGTAMKDGQLVASGGRVLAVTAQGRSLGEARDRAYRALEAIQFDDGFHRRDIGWRELERAQ